jgi:hypothetical protein
MLLRTSSSRWQQTRRPKRLLWNKKTLCLDRNRGLFPDLSKTQHPVHTTIKEKPKKSWSETKYAVILLSENKTQRKRKVKRETNKHLLLTFKQLQLWQRHQLQ